MSANATAFGQMCFHLNDSQYTKEELSQLCGIAIGTVIKWMRILRRRKLVYVFKWRRPPVGPPAAVWAWGYEMTDAPRPKAMTQAQYSERYRAKKRGGSFSVVVSQLKHRME